MPVELVLLLTLVLQAGRGAAADPTADPGFRVIVHASNDISELSRRQLSDIFMKRTLRWTDRSDIVPVDQSPSSRVRARFSRVIHGKSIAFVTRYWQRLIFSGRGIPPVELNSNEAVIELVRSNPGAIGYVENGVPLSATVRVVAVRP